MLTNEADRRLLAGRAILRQRNADMRQGMTQNEIEQLLSLFGRVLDNVDRIES